MALTPSAGGGTGVGTGYLQNPYGQQGQDPNAVQQNNLKKAAAAQTSYYGGSMGTSVPGYSTGGATPSTPPAATSPNWRATPPVAAAPPAASGAAGGTPGALSGPGASETFYSQHGNDLMTPSASEQLYAEGAAGSNPYYEYAQQQANSSIDAAERARGGYNSGAALAEEGNQDAYLRGQQAQELGQLAGQADTAKLGRYGLTGQEADTAQSHEENRLNTGFNNELALDTAQANPVGGFYSTAGGEAQQSGMAGIEAQLKASGMSAAEINQLIGVLGQGANIGIKAAGA